MKKKILLVTTALIVLICITSCGNSQTNTDTEGNTTKEIEYNDNIQNVFFGVHFGATRKEVIDGFAKNYFYENKYSTNDRLTFDKRDGCRYCSKMESYSFGGMNWSMIYVNITNNHFQSIEFANAFKTKKTALENFEDVLSVVSSKYKLYENPMNDTSCYKRYSGKTTDNKWVTVYCGSYESLSYERWVTVTLAYGDENFNEVSEEL